MPASPPRLPPFAPGTRDQIVTTLAELRKTHSELLYALQAGLPVAPDLATVSDAIARLQRLHDAYFPTPPI